MEEGIFRGEYGTAPFLCLLGRSTTVCCSQGMGKFVCESYVKGMAD